jgi:glycosyltransferase involved in cell wall biosynthesis
MKIKESPLSKKLIRIIRYRLYYPFNQQLLRDSDHVVFISNYQADKIISRIPLESYSVIYNPLSAAYLTKLPDKKITKKILYVGALKAYKGIEIILDAMPSVLKQHKNIHLTLAGTGNVTKYQNKAKALSIAGNVTFTDKVPPEKLIDLYDQADILVAPSIRPEPFGRTIIEGMARQCVPVASNHGGPTEIIQDGKTGFLSRVGDFRHLSELIALLYNDGAKLSEICHEARIDSIKRFNPALIAEKYGKIFTNTINNTKLY